MLTDDSLDDTIDLVPDAAPPFAPLSAAQQLFVDLHRDRLVVKYQWLMQGAQFRAVTDRGKTATLSKQDAHDLVDRGLFEWGVGEAYMRERK